MIHRPIIIIQFYICIDVHRFIDLHIALFHFTEDNTSTNNKRITPYSNITNMAALTISIGSIVDSPSKDDVMKSNKLTVEVNNGDANYDNDENNNSKSNNIIATNPQIMAVKDASAMVGHSPESGTLFKDLTPKDKHSTSSTSFIKSTLKKNITSLTWEKYINTHDMDWLGARTKELEYLVSKFDMPSKYRPQLWMKWSGGEELKKDVDKDYFQNLLKLKPTEKVMKQIELDLPRTCPKNERFNTDDAIGREELRQILYSYALRNPKLGYLQSMNFIAAQLLIVTNDVETSFWIMTAVVELMLGDGFYLTGLGDLLKNIDTFTELVAVKLPDVSQKLNSVGLNISFRVPNWFLCMYFNSFEEKTTTRVWDMIFFHASSTPAALSCIGLALVQHAGKAILNAKNAPECAQALQSMFYRNNSPEQLIDNAFFQYWSIDEIKRSLNSNSIKKAVNKKRKTITAPQTSRKHKRSRSEGDNSSFFMNNNTNFNLGSNSNDNRRRGIPHTTMKRRRTATGALSKDDTYAQLSSKLYSPFAAFKSWLTPSKKANNNNVSKNCSNKKKLNFASPKPGMTFHAHNIRTVENLTSIESGSPMGMEMKPVKSVRKKSKLSKESSK